MCSSNMLTKSNNSGLSKTECVVEIGPNDVLLGRGATIDNNPGNVKFRAIIRNQKEAYISSSRHQNKQDIAHLIGKAIHEAGGKFLRKIDSMNELTSLGFHKNDDVWAVADEITILLKIKQALRDKGKQYRDTYKRTMSQGKGCPNSGNNLELPQDAATTYSQFATISRPSPSPTVNSKQLKNALDNLVATQLSKYVSNLQKIEQERQLQTWIQNQFLALPATVGSTSPSAQIQLPRNSIDMINCNRPAQKPTTNTSPFAIPIASLNSGRINNILNLLKEF